MELDGADKEKDFYFSKLRDIEMMLQDLEDKGEGTELTAAIFKILYATADGFDQAAAEEEGVVVPEEAEDETF
jgi:RP/EB family microtubule-associated protein